MINGLPERLKALRIQNNMSQKEVAARLAVSPSIVSGYEVGTRTPSLQILMALASMYGCSTDYLLGRKATPPKPVLDTEGLTDAQIQAVQNLVNTIKNEGR